MPRVLNAHSFSKGAPGVIYIGRPYKWGNPFIIGQHGTREEVVELYREYLLSNQDLMAQLPELRGKDLLCWCAPHACHGDILIELANKESDAGT